MSKNRKKLDIDLNSLINPTEIIKTTDNFNNNNRNYVIIDGSYYCFYRYYALTNWWRNANPEDKDDTNYIDKPEFVDKFKKIFQLKIKEIIKKLKIENPTIIVAKDCARENIWRNSYIENYKSNRIYDETFKQKGCGAFFKIVFEENLFVKGGVSMIIEHPKLEADDCAAIYSKMILDKSPNSHIYIITSDQDYLQLACNQIKLFNLQYKDLTEKSLKNPEKDLLYKIILGDKSDNISGVFDKVGNKTALKLVEDQNLLEKKLGENEEYKKKFELNKKIIDFNEIPLDLVNEFKANYDL